MKRPPCQKSATGRFLGATAATGSVKPFHHQDAKPGGRSRHGRRTAVGAASHYYRLNRANVKCCGN
jgi:hypothetical protein